MKCEEIAELLPDYLQEGLAAERKSVVERHLESCVECREVAGLWKKLALIPDEQPSAASRTTSFIFITARESRVMRMAAGFGTQLLL